CAENRILCGFSDSELQNGFGRNFDFRPGCRVTADSGLSLLLHQLSEPRKRELTLLRFTVSEIDKTGYEILSLLLAHSGLPRHFRNDLCLSHLCHPILLSSFHQ